MNMNDINKIFTEKVTKLIAQGYIINVATMGGSQGEIGKVDLCKGEELIRVWLEMKNDCEHLYRDYVVLQIGRWTHSVKDSWRTVWMGEVDALECINFYKISKDYYTTDYEYAKQASQISFERSKRKYNGPSRTFMDDDARKEIAVKYLKRKHGYKRVSRNNISLRYYHSNHQYTVVYNDNYYDLK